LFKPIDSHGVFDGFYEGIKGERCAKLILPYTRPG
jgi:hypothetical protein